MSLRTFGGSLADHADTHRQQQIPSIHLAATVGVQRHQRLVDARGASCSHRQGSVLKGIVSSRVDAGDSATTDSVRHSDGRAETI